jgi:hypothetical protein
MTEILNLKEQAQAVDVIANLERQVRELDSRYTAALVEINRLRSRNEMQAETIERYRDELSERTHGYRG